jgi:hypothetical protein
MLQRLKLWSGVHSMRWCYMMFIVLNQQERKSTQKSTKKTYSKVYSKIFSQKTINPHGLAPLSWRLGATPRGSLKKSWNGDNFRRSCRRGVPEIFGDRRIIELLDDKNLAHGGLEIGIEDYEQAGSWTFQSPNQNKRIVRQKSPQKVSQTLLSPVKVSHGVAQWSIRLLRCASGGRHKMVTASGGIP